MRVLRYQMKHQFNRNWPLQAVPLYFREQKDITDGMPLHPGELRDKAMVATRFLTREPFHLKSH